VRVLHRVRMYAFGVTPEHVHLLLSEPERGTIANAIQSLKISSAKRSNQNPTWTILRSPLCRKRYYDRDMRDYEEFLEKLHCRYNHRSDGCSFG